MDRNLLEGLRRCSEAAWPAEACGILGGPAGDPSWRLTVSLPLANRAGWDRFRVDPVEFARAEAALRARGCTLRGFYHSHPSGTASPSTLDLQAAWRGHLLVVVPMRAGTAGQPRCWWPQGAGAVPVTWE